MKLLLASRFPPSLGGVETMGVLIAREWAKHPVLELKVVSDAPGPPLRDVGYELIQCPSMATLHRLYRWSDAVFFNHCYLRLGAPLLWQRKPYVMSMSGTLDTLPADTLRSRLKSRLLRRLLTGATRNIAACTYVKTRNRVPATVIPNPYDSAIYHDGEKGPRTGHFFFGGRVNQAAKGCLDLVEALVACRKITGRDLTMSVAGDGPDLPAMKYRALEAGLGSSVRFLGVLKGEELADEMRRHQVIVVPSRYQEPIGIICLEGIACGCVAVGSSGGGLGASVGPCGYTFANGDVAGLTGAMVKAISLDEGGRRKFLDLRRSHLAQYQPAHVAAQYLAEVKLACEVFPR